MTFLDDWTAVTTGYLHELYDEIEELRRHRATSLAVAAAIDAIAERGGTVSAVTLRTFVSNLRLGHEPANGGRPILPR